MTENERLTFALAQLDRVQAFHGRAEGRVPALLATNVAMAIITIINLTKPVLDSAWVGVAAFALVFTGYAIFRLLVLSYSRLDNKVKPSLLYFGDVARQKSDVYVAAASQASAADLIDDALCQVWRNSEILDAKFARAQRAFFATVAAICCWLIFLLDVTIQTGALPMLSTK